MPPVEVLELVMDEEEKYIVEIKGSAELLEKCKKTFPGIKRTVKEPEMFSLALPELGETNVGNAKDNG